MPNKREVKNQRNTGKKAAKPRSANPGTRVVRPTIGVLIGSVVSPIDWEVWSGANSAAQELDLNLICFAGGELNSPVGFDAQANVLYDMINTKSLDGLVVWGGGVGQFVGPEKLEAFCNRYHPLPTVNASSLLEGVPSILVDNYHGMREVMIHLIEAHGYRRIAFVRGPEGHREAEERYRAYTDVLAEYHIPLNPDLVAPGRFDRIWGTKAVDLFLEQRELLPHADIEAIVAADDETAMGVLEALQARGIRVPEDIAVVGFDNTEEGRYTSPPLTTVPSLAHEQARRAIETVHALINGEEAPDQVSVPTHLIVRQSCGCVDPAVTQAAAEAVPATGETLKETLAAQRKEMLFEIAQMMETPATGLDLESAQKLTDAFVTELEENSPGLFISTLDQTLRQAAEKRGNLSTWQGIISVLRRYTQAHLANDNEALTRAEILWQQARIMIGRVAERERAQQALNTRRRIEALSNIGQTLITATSIDKLTDELAQELTPLGIERCYLSLYENAESPAEWSRLVLAYDEGGRIEMESRKRRFPSPRLAPGEMFRRDKRYSLLLLPLYFTKNQLGFILFEASPQEAEIYEPLRRQLSNALHKTLLIQQTEDRSRQIQTAAEVSQAASSILDPDELIQRVVDLTRERLNLYYAGLFLLDETGEWAVLRAGTGEPGQQMVAQGHRLDVGGDSMIGRCVATAQARIALDVGKEATRFDNPLLPETRSELALPLISRGEVIGALTIQSTRESAFSQEDIAALQTMANQLAIAIENAHLFERTQAMLSETEEQAHRLALLNEMSERLNRAETVDQVFDVSAAMVSQIFTADRASVALLTPAGDSFEILALEGEAGATPAGARLQAEGSDIGVAVRERRLVIKYDDRHSDMGDIRSFIVAPLLVGQQAIGTLNVASQQPNTYTERDGNLLLQIASLLSSAIETRRLFEQTQAALEEVEATNRRYMEREWTEYLQTTRTLGYETRRPDAAPLGDAVLPEIQKALEREGTTALTGDGPEGESSALVTPVALRGAIIGALGIHDEDGERQWTEEEIALMEAVAERLALAAENLRLLEGTQRRAARERLTHEITDKMRDAADMDELIHTAMREMTAILDTTNAFVQLGAPPESGGDGRE